MTNDETKSFYTVKEFASVLRVHETTVRRLIKKGRINAFRIGAERKSGYRIPRDEISRMAAFDLEKIVNVLVEQKLKK